MSYWHKLKQIEEKNFSICALYVFTIKLRKLKSSWKHSNLYFTASRAPAAPRSRPAGAGGASAAQLEELNAQVLEKNLTIEGLEKERDFYFGKLRDIEVLVQEHETVEGAAEFCQKVLGVLYATEVRFQSINFILVDISKRRVKSRIFRVIFI